MREPVTITVEELPKINVNLDNFAAGVIQVYKSRPNVNWPELVGSMMHNGMTKGIQMEGSFMGMLVGKPRDETKKYEFVFINYPKEAVDGYNKILEVKNKKN